MKIFLLLSGLIAIAGIMSENGLTPFTTAVAIASDAVKPGLGSGTASPAASTPAASTKPFTKIDSDVLDFDYDKRIAIFEGNVNAVDPQLTLKCKTMKVFFADKDDEVIRVEAYSKVQMFHLAKEAVGEKAVFTRESGIIVLSGGDCRLKDEKGNLIRSKGDGIIYNIQTKQMHVDKPTLEIRPSSDGGLLKTDQAK